MNKPKISRVILTEGATVTLPQPVGSRSSVDVDQHRPVELGWHPVGVRVSMRGMKRAVVIPFSHIKSIEEELGETTPEEKRGPGRPPKNDPSA